MQTQKRSALFVDFDNIYIALRQVDPVAAEEFATNPTRWLAWLERYGESAAFEPEAPASRRVLLRNCYLNPKSFGRYRADFSRAAFRVVDCPPITRQGKTSTDIQVVMDVLDSLVHPTRFDEFILLSADADFTPLLQRLRLHDRRTVVVSIGPASPAYRNAADVVISEDEFVTLALGGRFTAREREEPTVGEADADTLDTMADALVEATREEGALLPSALPRIYVRFAEFRGSTDWLGHWSLRGLTEALVARRPEALAIDESGPQWSIALVAPGEAQRPLSFPSSDHESLRATIFETVRELVVTSPSPVPMATAAQHVVDTLGRRVSASEWAGAGSFKALVGAAAEPGLQLAQLSPTKWVILDPERHEVPETADAVGGDTPAARLVRRVSRTTGVPALTPEQYTALFESLFALLGAGGFDLTETSKQLRDVLVERGVPISRTSLSFVLRGLIFSGHALGDPTAFPDATAVARAFRRQVATLCDDANLELTDEEEALLDSWIHPAQ
ncbi:MAG: NYN domain-containing protein [Myxococcales bacterium]|nr:NYN domain-containing protein [Myxococcales bacterium]MCB9531920.1 NYN domain-containing protein [Myxococcales bacterium]MCB9533888.1 NYN domain-containing protein [Myxococcales bacterium]